MMRSVLGVALSCGLMFSAAASAGSVTGTVVYDGEVKRSRLLNMSSDPGCVKASNGERIPNPAVTLGKDQGVANVFVHIANPPAGPHTAPSEPLVIDQDGCMYHPRVAGTMVGQPVKYLNSDGILHNVHGLPKANREFNVPMPPRVRETEQSFNKPEPLFPVKCDVHPWMQSFLAVMDHPYFAVTDGDGRFSIEGLADGTYEVAVWHERFGTQTGTATVKDGAATVDFSFQGTPKR